MTGFELSVADRVPHPFRNRRGRWLSVVLVVALLLIPALVFFRRQLLIGLGESLVVSDPLEHADLIYVLAGDFWGSRVLLGAKLGSEGWARRVILGGGRYNTRYASDLSVDFAVQHGYPRGLFLPVRVDAVSTIDEARVLGPVFHRLGAKRIILVTNNFHSQRAFQVFRLLLPEFDFRMESAPDGTFDPLIWWEEPRERHLLFSEYQKLIGTYLIRFHLASAEWLGQFREGGQ